MKTKYYFHSMVALIVLTIILAIFAQTVGAKSVDNTPRIGDCLADRTVGDLYPENDPYCLPENGDTIQEKERKENPGRVIQVTIAPENTAIPTVDVTETPAPELTPVSTEEPTAVPTQEPTVEPSPEATETPACKNKNSGKDGTPAECNAGGGQEKHQ